MAKYTITIEGDFEKGDCWECPISYDTTDIYGDYTMRCLVVDCDDCPLEEVEQGEWILIAENSTGNLYRCSVCTYIHNPNKEDVFMDRMVEKPKFCPNCGKSMKGGN